MSYLRGDKLRRTAARLDAETDALNEFILSDKFRERDDEERKLIQRQAIIQGQLLDVLHALERHRPTSPLPPATEEQDDQLAADGVTLPEITGPDTTTDTPFDLTADMEIGGQGRGSIAHSYRGEGDNTVD